MTSLNLLDSLVECTARSDGRCHCLQTLHEEQTAAIKSNAALGTPALRSKLAIRPAEQCHHLRCNCLRARVMSAGSSLRSCRNDRPRSKLDQSGAAMGCSSSGSTCASIGGISGSASPYSRGCAIGGRTMGAAESFCGALEGAFPVLLKLEEAVGIYEHMFLEDSPH